VIAVLRAEEQDNRAFQAPREAALHDHFVVVQFLPKAAPELFPPVGVVAKPPSQLVTRGDLLYPVIEVEIVLADSARPDAIDQQPCTVRLAEVI
jgi:hypothetical protein